jgi:hypothetical protein
MKRNSPRHESLCGTEFVAPFNINFDARRQPIVSYTTRPPYRQENKFLYLQSRCGWYRSRSGHRTPDTTNNYPLCCKQSQVADGRQKVLWAPTDWAGTDVWLNVCSDGVLADTAQFVRWVGQGCRTYGTHAQNETRKDFLSQAAFTAAPYTAVKHLYTNRDQCEVLTGYLSLGRWRGGDWANTWHWKGFTVFFW